MSDRTKPRALRITKTSRRIEHVAERDGWTCWLCGEPIDPDSMGVHRASADRVLPGSLGGTYTPENVALAHQSCNEHRSGSKATPFAPFDNHWAADHERREAWERRWRS